MWSKNNNSFTKILWRNFFILSLNLIYTLTAFLDPDHLKMTLKSQIFRFSGLRGFIAAGLLCSALAMSVAATAAPGKWEQVKSERSDTHLIAKDSDTEIRVARGVVVVTTSRPTQVKIYTILGQLVTRETLPAGISQISIQPHGVYIIKIGDLTCKAAL